MTDIPSFDAVMTPLAGRLVIEASAGTGKTWSLTRLVLRLVVEEAAPVGRILLVTFTKAATAELSARVKELLAAALAAAEGASSAGDLAPFFEHWKALGLADEDVKARLKAAVDNYDDAAVYTIHSFCQRMMKDFVFSQGGDFELVNGDVTPLINQTVEEFLRREVRRTKDAAVQNQLLKGKWVVVLKRLAQFSSRTMPDVLRLSDVEDAGKTKGKKPEIDPQVREEVNAALARFIDWAPGRLANLKREAKLQSFDDILVAMDGALVNDEFAQAVRGRFDAVLIDEFQDTDTVQYGIFKTLFMAEGEGPQTLVFVGDPKQSIYSFRSSDIAVYSAAVKDVGRTMQLTANWRSTPVLVDAVNAFFAEGEGRQPFLTDSIRFSPVEGKAVKKAPLALAGEAVPVFEVWRGKGAAHFPSAGESDAFEAEAVAEDIVRLLNGKATIDGRPLKPSDIALLVKKREDASETVAALKKRGLRVLWRNSKDDVLKHEAPRDMMAVLKAVESPKDRRLLAAAQATRLFGRSLKAIRDGLAERIEDSLLLKTLAERFEKGGAAALFSELLAARHADERLLATSSGMRYLADCRHMTEMLHERGRTLSTLSGLIQRIEAERFEPVDDESDRTARVESDEDLINVQTLHSSKGLEYPVVYLVGASRAHQLDKSAVFHVHDEVQDVWYVGAEEASEDLIAQAAHSRLEEAVRLLYVGMTRASHRLVLPLFFTRSEKTRKLTYYRCANAAVFALWGDKTMVKYTDATAHAEEVLESLKTRLAALPADLVQMRLFDITAGAAETHAAAPADTSKTLTAAPAKRFGVTQRLSSFTGIMRTKKAAPAMAGAEDAPREADDDAGPDEGEKEALAATSVAEAPEGFDPAALRGPDVGTFLHEIMERAEFDTDEGRSDLIKRLIRKYSGLFPAEDREAAQAAWLQYIEDMMRAVLAAPLENGLRLRDVPREKRASEWPFTMCAGKDGSEPRTTGLARLLARYPRYAVGDLDDVTLRGYLTGTADLLFEASGRYYLVDWKSNVIGSGRPADYTEEAMADEMTRHGYRLQYLIYLTAFCRFLAERLGVTFEEAYERVGGVFYIFLRGAGEGGVTQGIVRDRPPVEVLSSLNEFFGKGAA